MMAAMPVCSCSPAPSARLAAGFPSLLYRVTGKKDTVVVTQITERMHCAVRDKCKSVIKRNKYTVLSIYYKNKNYFCQKKNSCFWITRKWCDKWSRKKEKNKWKVKSECQPICLLVRISFSRLSAHLSVGQSASLSVWLPTCLPVCLSVCLPVRHPIWLWHPAYLGSGLWIFLYILSASCTLWAIQYKYK